MGVNRKRYSINSLNPKNGYATVKMEITDGMSAKMKVVKRFLDVVGAVVCMVILSPVFLIIYLAIKIGGSNNVIYRQERIGYKGRPFMILKFRTMKSDSEPEGKPMLAEVSDDRLTRIGKFLRERHLDELPQLWNVLRGDMSFVGPRPERRYFINLIRKENTDYDYVLLMKPGLTSDATLYNGYTDTMEKMLIRLNMDLEYLQKRSLWVDTKIVLTTVAFILKGKKF